MKKGSPAKHDKKKDTHVEEVQIDFSDPLMLIALLGQDNIGRTLLALKSLKSFVLPTHIKLLLQTNLLEKLAYHITYKNSLPDIIEYSLSLLSELLNYDSVLKRIAEDDGFIVSLYQLFKNKPADIQVNCLKCLAHLTKLKNPCNVLYSECDLNLFFIRFSPADPDNQSSILKILYNLVQDIEIAEKVVNLQGFNYNLMLHLLSSDYPTVQHLSANLIHWLTSYSHVTGLRDQLVQDNGVHTLINIIETHKWPDLHEKIYKIFVNLSNIDETFEKLGDDGLKMMISYIDDIESKKLQFASYDSILKMCKNSSLGLYLFVGLGLMDVIYNHLKDDMKSPMFKLSIVGLSIVSKQDIGLNILDEDPDLIVLLMDILNNKDDLFDWNIRYQAAEAIYSMVTNSKIFLEMFKTKQMWKTIINLLIYFPETAPNNIVFLLLNIIKKTVLEFYGTLKQSIKYTSKLIQVIKTNMMNPKLKDIEMKCIATEIMEMLVEFPEFREMLKSNKVYTSLAKLMFRTNVNLLILESYLKLFITLSEWDSAFIDELIYVHAIDWFVNKNDIIQKLPIARRFLDLVFTKCTHLKIHFTNRLEPWDRIQTGFYLERGGSMNKDSYFKPLAYFLREKDVKLRPVYYIDFGDSNLRIDLSRTSSHTTMGQTYHSDDVVTEEKAIDECFQNQVDPLKDPYLMIRLEELKVLLGYHHDDLIELNLSVVLNTLEYKYKIQTLAEFVCKAMNSVDEITDDHCQNHSFELHLTEIKEDLGTTIIPLGYVKIGTKLEKALLFKALGDHVGIPSALVRGYCGNGWNEIYLAPPKKEFFSEISQNSLKGFGKGYSVGSMRQSNFISSSRFSIQQKNMSTRKSLRIQPEKKGSLTSSLRSRSISIKSLPQQEKVEPERQSQWHLKAYHDFIKTNFIVDLDHNPGQLIPIGSVEADSYTTKSCCLHPYFFERTPLPPLIKRNE